MDKLSNSTSNYTVVPNEIFDILHVSTPARFLYIYLRSRPDNWKIRVTNLQNVTGFKRDKIYSMLNELKDANLLSYHRQNDGGGTYTLHEITTSGNTGCDKTGCDKTADIASKERAVNTDYDNLFVNFWNAYPRKQGKVDAMKAFIQACSKLGTTYADAFVVKLICDITNRKARDRQWQKKQFIPLPASYIRGEKWSDEIIPVSNDENSGLPMDRKAMEKIAVSKGIHSPGASPMHLADDHAYRQWLTEKLR